MHDYMQDYEGKSNSLIWIWQLEGREDDVRREDVGESEPDGLGLCTTGEGLP